MDTIFFRLRLRARLRAASYFTDYLCCWQRLLPSGSDRGRCSGWSARYAPTIALRRSRFLLREDELGNVMTARSIDEIERNRGYNEKYSANENNRKQRQSENQE